MERHVNREQDDVQAEQEDSHPDDEYEDYGPRSIFAAGWVRAVLVLVVLAIVAVVAVPYLLDWFGPGQPPATRPERVTKGAEAPPTPAPVPESQSVASAPSGPAPQSSVAPAVPAPATGPAHATAPAWAPPKRSPERVAGVPTRPSSEARGTYWVQVGSFKDAGNAERLARKLKEEGLSAQVASVTRRESAAAGDAGSGGTYHLVRVGAFPDRRRAVAARDDLESRGYPGFLTRGAAK